MDLINHSTMYEDYAKSRAKLTESAYEDARYSYQVNNSQGNKSSALKEMNEIGP